MEAQKIARLKKGVANDPQFQIKLQKFINKN